MSNDYLTAFYESHCEDARLRTPHGMVEFLTTMRYVEKYLKPGDRVIEIGAGTGRCSHALADPETFKLASTRRKSSPSTAGRTSTPRWTMSCMSCI